MATTDYSRFYFLSWRFFKSLIAFSLTMLVISFCLLLYYILITIFDPIIIYNHATVILHFTLLHLSSHVAGTPIMGILGAGENYACSNNPRKWRSLVVFEAELFQYWIHIKQNKNWKWKCQGKYTLCSRYKRILYFFSLLWPISRVLSHPLVKRFLKDASHRYFIHILSFNSVHLPRFPLLRHFTRNSTIWQVALYPLHKKWSFPFTDEILNRKLDFLCSDPFSVRALAQILQNCVFN